VTLAGNVATAVLSLASVTAAPPAGAAAPLAARVTAYRLSRLMFRWLDDSLAVGASPFDHTGGCRTQAT
jgi:hypothetical protein